MRPAAFAAPTVTAVPQFRLGRRNPDATDGKFTDSTMPLLNRQPPLTATPVATGVQSL